MSFDIFLEPVHLVQTLLLALSIFNLVAFLWLAMTVWLNGDRRTWIARIGVIGLSFSAFFFFIHALLISSPIPQTSGSISLDFLWHLIWIPAVAVPYIWFAIGLHYASLINQGWKHRRPMLLISSGVIGCVVLLLLIIYRSTFTFTGTLQLLAYNDYPDNTYAGVFSPIVLLPVLFLFYVTFCAIGPWFTLGRINRLIRVIWNTLTRRLKGASDVHVHPPTLWQSLANAFWDDPTEVELLEEPVLSWHLARPGLFFAAILMVGLTTTLGILGIWSLVDWLKLQQTSVLLDSAPPVINGIPLNLLILDTLATGSVAIIILLVGYSVMRHGVLIERPLARRGFFEQWRGIVIVATTIALFIALLVDFTHSNLGGLLLITSLATVVYALFTWSSYTAHDRYIALLGPFLRSTNQRHWLNTDLQKTEQGLENLFFHLCQDVLAVRFARMTIMSGSVRSNFRYRWPVDAQNVTPLFEKNGQTSMNYAPKRIWMHSGGRSMICWVLPIYDDPGLVAVLYLGPRQDGGVFTDEDMDLARACGERILDTLSEHKAMQAVAGLLRRRIVDVKLLGAQQRRVLHDDILPQMHLALLRLEMLRAAIASPKIIVPQKCEEKGEGEECTSPEQILDETAAMISEAHRRLAAMMRATAPSAPHRLERDGMMHAIRTMLEQDFQQSFDEVEWRISEETAGCIDDMTPPAIAELIFAAVQEALRNAARHARGSDVHRHLKLTIDALCSRTHPQLEVLVTDDGVGILSASSSTTGTGGGLLTHNALLAIAGGSLTVKSIPNEGVTVRIALPPESLC